MTATEQKVKVNKSKTYLLPLINEYLSIQFDEYIENTYVYIKGFEECFGIVYRKDISNTGLKQYYERLVQNSLFKSVVEFDNHILFIFEFPDFYISEYYSFLDGGYSKFSEHSKKNIIRYTSDVHKYPDAVQGVVHILYKNKVRKEELERQLDIKLDDDAELSSIIDRYEETFNSKQYEN